jgi:hypothetical protein
MLPVSNDNVNKMDDVNGAVLKEMNVRQIIEARNSVSEEMRNELKVNSNHCIQACYLNRKQLLKIS